MKHIIRDLWMRDAVSRAGSAIALSAAAMSIVWGAFVPYGYPWPSLAWIVLACAAAVWVKLSSIRPMPRMSDVIRAVEAEPSPVVAAPVSRIDATGGLS